MAESSTGLSANLLIRDTYTHQRKSHQSQFEAQYHAQGHFYMQAGRAGGQTDPSIGEQPTLPPEPLQVEQV